VRLRLTKEKLRRVAKIIVLSLAIGAVLGYFTFYMTMPSVVVPQTVNPSMVLAGIVIFLLGLVAGALSEDLESMTIEMLLGIIIGVFIGWLVFVSPAANPDIIIPDAGGYIYNIIHSSLPLLFLAIVALFIGGFIGTMFMDSLYAKDTTSPFAKAVSEREDEQHNQ